MTTYGTYDGKEEAITIGAVTGILEIDDSITDCGTVLNDCNKAIDNKYYGYYEGDKSKKGKKDKNDKKDKKDN